MIWNHLYRSSDRNVDDQKCWWLTTSSSLRRAYSVRSNGQCERTDRTCFPRVSPLDHCTFQLRVPGLALFAVVSVRECGKILLKRYDVALIPSNTGTISPPTRPFSSRNSRDSSGHCRHARRTVIGFSRLLSFPRGKSSWICERVEISGIFR